MRQYSIASALDWTTQDDRTSLAIDPMDGQSPVLGSRSGTGRASGAAVRLDLVAKGGEIPLGTGAKLR